MLLESAQCESLSPFPLSGNFLITLFTGCSLTRKGQPANRPHLCRDTVVVSTSMTKAHPHGGNRSRKFRLQLLRCCVLRAFRHNPDLIGGGSQETRQSRSTVENSRNYPILCVLFTISFLLCRIAARSDFGCARVSQLHADRAKSQRNREK